MVTERTTFSKLCIIQAYAVCLFSPPTTEAVSSWLITQMCGKKNLPDTFDYQGHYMPQHLAFLDMIAHAEGTTQFGAKEYRAQYPNKTFSGGFEDHPRTVNTSLSRGKPLSSSAAGRYQFLTHTWDAYSNRFSLVSFEPHNQDLGALALLDSRKVLSLLAERNYDVREAIWNASRVWPSLPGSPYQQPKRPLQELLGVFSKQLQVYQQMLFHHGYQNRSEAYNSLSHHQREHMRFIDTSQGRIT